MRFSLWLSSVLHPRRRWAGCTIIYVLLLSGCATTRTNASSACSASTLDETIGRVVQVRLIDGSVVSGTATHADSTRFYLYLASEDVSLTFPYHEMQRVRERTYPYGMTTGAVVGAGLLLLPAPGTSSGDGDDLVGDLAAGWFTAFRVGTALTALLIGRLADGSGWRTACEQPNL